jgi:putative MFS transporter
MNMPTTPQSVGHWFRDMPVTRTHWVAGLILFVTFIIDSWEMMILILSSESIAAEFNLGTAQIGSLIGAIFLGMIPGALMWGRLADRLGRKKCMILSLALYAPIPLLSALAPSFEVLWWLRFTGGIILSGALVITFPYFQELIPVKARGKATVYLSAGWPVGLLVAVGITALLMDSGWRWIIGFSSLSGLWALALYKLVPESPYWLAEQGRLEDANHVISQLSHGSITANTIPTGVSSTAKQSFFKIFRQPVTRITFLQTIINFCFSWGYWALASWMPVLLSKRGLDAPEGLSFIAISAVFMFPGYISASYLTGKFGRKPIMLVYVFVAAVAGFGFANSESLTQMYMWNFTLSFFSLGAWGVWNTWMGEIYDTQTRSAGVAWGVSMQRVANAVAPVAIGAMLATSSFLQTVTFISAFLAATFITTLFLPETEGQILK